MLKITTIDTPRERKLVLEGGIVEPWVTELRRAWDESRDAPQHLKVVVDLKGVTVISDEGKEYLSEMIRQGAQFTCGGVYVKHVLRDLQTRCGCWFPKGSQRKSS